MKKACFAAGCFWGVEAEFRKIPGVVNATCGYTGGHAQAPTYKQVCSGTTGHAEAVELEYDPQLVSYDQLLQAFWEMHDPTTKDRQGPDVGTQYRSAIFFYDSEQEAEARASMEEVQKKLSAPIVTLLVPAAPFYRAEDYHQEYFAKQCRL
ncbi:MAG: peptide-methionine (S)-S-oxide reductase MsrA [Bdellovibrionaceae bacterium]|nr:peptide-methionine (S)-S-oxide reductase MsrA [Bdellovibrionales bacterium]MCB9255138.1 peptide-methionine (S)-S-oxide reductase MsrA [Pseudobdellovibrionaceae bacterium]